MLKSLAFETHANVFRCVMGGHKLLLLEVPSHAEIISSRATYPTYNRSLYALKFLTHKLYSRTSTTGAAKQVNRCEV